MHKKNLLVRSLVLGGTLITTAMLLPAQAHDYNDGLRAAEVGDYATAVNKWRPLAQRGDALAQFNLALMYHSGSGVAADESRAVSLYQQSAANGYDKAQEFLSAAYREGWFGLPRDPKQSDYWAHQLQQQN
ncbi:MAG: sel1 repeat family protein [Gammaproteobacteria bacterium]|nr:sel1 repeat family protein [Gammaproteobacteria bacterium]